MPKIKKPPPAGILDHLIQRYREGRVSSADFLELKHWLESDPDVPKGKWYKRLKTANKLRESPGYRIVVLVGPQ